MKEREVSVLAAEGIFEGRALRGSIEETHISWVILTRRNVFKIKKPLKLDFLDFSTLKLRKARCEDEIRLNGRFTDIYIAVLPIRVANSKYFVGGDHGKTIDYAVWMKRMALTKRMDNVLKRSGVTIDSIVTLARVVSSAHQVCKPIYTPFVLSQAKTLFNKIVASRKFLIRNVPGSYGDIVTKSIRWSDEFLKMHSKRFQERIERGFKRDVHGDLHSRNVFLYKDPVIFDCIEFNDLFRQIDVLYEIAFLCMDLEAYDKDRLAKKFASEYDKQIRCFEVEEDHMIFNYFKCLRANIRAKVHAMSGMQAENDQELHFHLEETKKYIDLMQRYSSS